MSIEVGDAVKSLVSEKDLQEGKVYIVKFTGLYEDGRYVIVKDDVGDDHSLFSEEYEEYKESRQTLSVGDKVESLFSDVDITKNKLYTVIDIDGFPEGVWIEDDELDNRYLSRHQFKVVEQPVGIYELKISLEGSGSAYTKTKELHLPTGSDLISFIDKLNQL